MVSPHPYHCINCGCWAMKIKIFLWLIYRLQFLGASWQEDAAFYWNVAHVRCGIITHGRIKGELCVVEIITDWRYRACWSYLKSWWNGIAEDKTGSHRTRLCKIVQTGSCDAEIMQCWDYAMLRLHGQYYMDIPEYAMLRSHGQDYRDRITQDKIFQDKDRWRLLKCLFSETIILKIIPSQIKTG